MAIHSTTLFSGVLSGQQASWSGLLPTHKNLTNHQLCMTASETVDEGTGRYAVMIIPDTEGVATPVDTGIVLDLSGTDSALVNFTGVIRGIVLMATDIILQPSVRISSVLSSFSRYKRVGVEDDLENFRDTISSELNPTSTTVPSYAADTQPHSNMIYHQISLMASSGVDDVYALRIIPPSDVQLETTVDTGQIFDFAGADSALLYFGGVVAGIHLQKISGTSSGVTVRVVMSSSKERYDEVIYQYIGESPSLSDHESDFDNPHEVYYDQLLGDKPEVGYSMVRNILPVNTEFSIPRDHQYIVWERYDVQGQLTIEPDGAVIILHDRPEDRAENPDFTYNLNDELIQIDYSTGEQVFLTYSAGQLTRTDTLKLGTALRKSFFYTGGGNLDYVTEQWL